MQCAERLTESSSGRLAICSGPKTGREIGGFVEAEAAGLCFGASGIRIFVL